MVLLLLALAAYTANGAQAHIHVSHGETLEVAMCSFHGDSTMLVELPGEPPRATPETCCGDCTAPAALPADPPARITGPALLQDTYTARRAPLVHPGSALWPGAPPQGPPTARTA